jgi:hypothetical protein
MKNNNVQLPKTVLDVEKSLKKLHDKRGYLLPHHGLLAISNPNLLEAYDATYTHMTLTDKVLSLYEKEVIWFIILISTSEAIATHHIERLKKSGGSQIDIEAALATAVWAKGADYYTFVEKNCGGHLHEFDGVSKYRAGLKTITEKYEIEPKIFEIGLAAAHQCHRRWDWVAEHIIGAYMAGANEGAIAEGLALAMFPGGVPNFVDACDIWRKLIQEEKVKATEPYRAWASMSGLGGFDEAAGMS